MSRRERRVYFIFASALPRNDAVIELPGSAYSAISA